MDKHDKNETKTINKNQSTKLIALSSKKDRTTATANTHRQFREVRTRRFEISDGTDIQRDTLIAILRTPNGGEVTTSSVTGLRTAAERYRHHSPDGLRTTTEITILHADNDDDDAAGRLDGSTPAAKSLRATSRDGSVLQTPPSV